uniref:Polypeptide N-acetylgalactosaminyltransferase n=2 Tax=Cacopsylla melanoneura TaxID=428564 RepID=A0A8D8SF33_9HEMI
MVFCRRRLFRKLCFLLTAVSIFSLVLLWNHLEDLDTPDDDSDVQDPDDWLTLRLARNQQDYIDRRGVHVVVGHYLGDSIDGALHTNLTDEIINTNQFNPHPNEGRNGVPVNLPSHLHSKAQQLYQINRFNLLASDRIPLNRTLPDVRKTKCKTKVFNTEYLPKSSIVIVFHNEAWSTLLRTVHSVISRSPRPMLQEILLVDDASTREFLKGPLDEYISKLTVPVRTIRSPTRVGLIKARLLGARQAQGEVLVFLDAHCECTLGWLESLVARVAEDRTRVVCPVIDIISDVTFAYVRSFELHWGAFNWELHFRWYTYGSSDAIVKRKDLTEPFKTPAMAGGLFAIDKAYFFHIGAYDEQMQVWGGENLELSFRVWQCGGSVEIAPCSHVAHLFRKASPYTFPGGVSEVLYGNLARVALVWMDEWGEFYFKFNPEAEKQRDKQQVHSRLKLRKELKCHSFKWYLTHVWPNHFLPMDDKFFGRIRHVATQKCIEKPLAKGSMNQASGPASLQSCTHVPILTQMFVMKLPTDLIATDESVCLDVPEVGNDISPRVRILACSGFERQRWTYDKESQELRHVESKLCLDLSPKRNMLVLNSCTGYPSQHWDFESVPWK